VSTRPRAQALIEATAFLPILVLLVGALVYAWVGFGRQVAFATASNTLAEWIARNGTFTSAMSATLQGDLESNFGIAAADTAVYIRISDASGASVCSIGSAPDSPEDGVMPTSLGWGSRIGSGAPLSGGLPEGYQVSVTIWGYSSLPFTASGSYLAAGHAVAYAEDNGFSGGPSCT
jgi:hypothetical protein